MVLLMVEDLRFSSQQSGPEELSISSGVQAVSSDDAVPIQLIWEQPSEDAAVDTTGRFTEFLDAHPNWSTVNRRSLMRASCRKEASRLVTGQL